MAARTLIDAERYPWIYRRLYGAMAVAAVVALSIGYLRPAPWIFVLAIGVLQTVLWLVAVRWFMSRAWPPRRSQKPQPRRPTRWAYAPPKLPWHFLRSGSGASFAFDRGSRGGNGRLRTRAAGRSRRDGQGPRHDQQPVRHLHDWLRTARMGHGQLSQRRGRPMVAVNPANQRNIIGVVRPLERRQRPWARRLFVQDVGATFKVVPLPFSVRAEWPALRASQRPVGLHRAVGTAYAVACRLTRLRHACGRCGHVDRRRQDVRVTAVATRPTTTSSR